MNLPAVEIGLALFDMDNFGLRIQRISFTPPVVYYVVHIKSVPFLPITSSFSSKGDSE